MVAPDNLTLTSKSGQPVSGFFMLTAENGPVNHYTVKVPAALAGKVTVSPAQGSLQAGGYVKVTVTVTSKTALTAHIAVGPGNLAVTVTYKLKALVPAEPIKFGSGG